MAIDKFVVYKCNVCERTKTVTSNITHGLIDLCTITQNCTGRMLPIESKNERDVLVNSSLSGVEDWEINSMSVSFSEQQEYNNIVGGSDNRLVLGVKGSIYPDEIGLKFLVKKPEFGNTVEYVYQKSGEFVEVVGPDSTPQSKMMRFGRDDSIKVFIDGVELSEGWRPEEYTLLWNTDGIGYGIRFGKVRISSSVITVLISKSQGEQYSPELRFIKTSILDGTSSVGSVWSNVEKVKIDNDEFVLYECRDTSLIVKDVILNMVDGYDLVKSYPSDNIFDDSVHLDDFVILLSYEPYQVKDRFLEGYLKLSSLDKNFLIKTLKDKLSFYCNKEAISFTAKLPIRIISVFDKSKEILIESKVSKDKKLFPKNPKFLGVI